MPLGRFLVLLVIGALGCSTPEKHGTEEVKITAHLTGTIDTHRFPKGEVKIHWQEVDGSYDSENRWQAVGTESSTDPEIQLYFIRDPRFPLFLRTRIFTKNPQGKIEMYEQIERIGEQGVKFLGSYRR